MACSNSASFHSASPQLLSSACSPSPSRPLRDDVPSARLLLAKDAKTPVHIRRRRFLALHTRARTSLSSVRASSAGLPVDYRLFLLCIPLPLCWISSFPRSCVAHYQVRLFCSLSTGVLPPFSSSAAPSCGRRRPDAGLRPSWKSPPFVATLHETMLSEAIRSALSYHEALLQATPSYRRE